MKCLQRGTDWVFNYSSLCVYKELNYVNICCSQSQTECVSDTRFRADNPFLNHEEIVQDMKRALLFMAQ